LPTGEKPAGDRWLCRRAIVQQHDSIGDNSRRAMLQQQHSIDQQVDSTACEAGGTQIEPDVSIAPHAATLHSVAHSQIQFSLDSENLKDCCP